MLKSIFTAPNVSLRTELSGDVNSVWYRNAACKDFNFWFIMIISDHFLFPYFFNVLQILHFDFLTFFSFVCLCVQEISFSNILVNTKLSLLAQ